MTAKVAKRAILGVVATCVLSILALAAVAANFRG